MRTNPRFTLVRFGVGAVASTALLTGCTVSVSDTAAVSDSTSADEARNYVFTAMEQRTSSQDGEWVEDTLEDLLPQQEFSIDGADAAALAEGIVFGTVTDVAPGRGYFIEGADAAEGTEIPFDDSRALWRVIVLTVKTDTKLGDIDPKTIKVGVVIDGGLDTAAAQAGYAALGRVALVLNEPGKFEFDPSLYSVRQSGALLGVVSKNGTISFPAMGSESTAFLDGLDTVAEVVAGAKEDTDVVDVETDGGQFERDDQ